jgi:hypothetical protein
MKKNMKTIVKKPTRLGFFLALYGLLYWGLSAASAQMPVHVKQSLDRLVGHWETVTQLGGRQIIEHATLEWSADETTLFYEGEGEKFAIKGQKTHFSGVFGWDAKSQLVREFGFDNQGGTFFADHSITADSWSDIVTATSIGADGQTVSEVFKRTFHFESADTFVLESKNRVLRGQKGFKTVFRRVASKETEATDSPCPWEWMLGHWTVERSDGSSAKVHWDKPRSNVDSVVGKWWESDGNEFQELVGWEPDRKHLIAHGYGFKGSYFSVRFNEVSRNVMRGFLRSRDMEGVLQMSVVHLNRVSQKEVQSKIIMADGSIVSETFRRSK